MKEIFYLLLSSLIMLVVVIGCLIVLIPLSFAEFTYDTLQKLDKRCGFDSKTYGEKNRPSGN